MNSREYLKTASEILFKTLNIDVRDKAQGKKRSDTIKKYFDRKDNEPYSSIIEDIFVARISQCIYPEKEQLKFSELDVKVFLNKCIYMISTLFEVNFCFLRNLSFNEYREQVYCIIRMLTKQFSIKYENDRDEIIRFLMDIYCDKMHLNKKFKKSEIDEYFELYGKMRYELSNMDCFPSRKEMVISFYNSAIDYLKKCSHFFECLFCNQAYNNEVKRAAKDMYSTNVNKLITMYKMNPSKDVWNNNDTKFTEVSWKSVLTDLTFSDFMPEFCSHDILFVIEDIMMYVLGLNEEYPEIIKIIMDFEEFNKKYNIEGTHERVNQNVFVFKNKNYLAIESKLIKIKNYISIKRRMYFCLNIELDSD